MTAPTWSKSALVTDACTTSSDERHEQSLLGVRGYCRQCSTEALLAEIAALTNRDAQA